MPMNATELQELEAKLTQYREQIQADVKQTKSDIDAAIAKQSDAANKVVETVLKPQLAELEKALKSIQDTIKDNGTLGLPGAEAEMKQWSWTDFFRGQMQAVAGGKCNSIASVSDPWHHAPVVKELCVQYAKRRGFDVDERMGTAYKRDYNATDGSSGGFLVPSEISSTVIDATIANMPIGNIPNLLKLTNLTGEMFIPKIVTRNTGYMVAENTAPTKSTGSFGGVWLRPKKLGVFTKQSNRLLYQTKGVSDMLIKRCITEAAALKWHDQLINGSGAASEVKGLLQYSGMTTTINGDAISPTNGRQFLGDDALNMITALEEVDEITDANQAAFLMRPVVLRGMQRERVKMYAAQSRANAAGLYPNVYPTKQGISDYLGAGIYTTSQISASNTQGTSTTSSKVLCGNWSLFAVGSWRDPVFKVSDVASDGSTGSAFLDDQFYAVMFIEFDAALLRETALALFEGAETKPSSW